MLDPKTTCLVLLDALTPSIGDKPLPLSAIRVLLRASKLLSVPLFVARFPDAPGPWLLASALTAEGLVPNQVFDPATPNWASTQLGLAVAATDCSQMIVCGLCLEEAVTLLSLKGLSVGLDTYVPVDATSAFESAHAFALHARLTQAGAVPTTTAQIVREWAAMTDVSTQKTALLSLLCPHTVPSP